MNKLVPLKDRVIAKLEPFKSSEFIIHAGTYSMECPNYGVIRFLGPKAKEIGLNIGDRIFIEQYKGREWVNFANEELKILKLEDILGVIE